MISRLHGTLLTRQAEAVEVQTSGGVVYEVEVPTTVLERLPSAGQDVELRTVQVVREDSVALYGFLTGGERTLFQRLLTASGVGPRVALAMLSTYSAERLARALVEKDTTALRQVSGIGRKTAERLALELADRVADLSLTPADRDGGASPVVQEATAALVALGYTFAEADEAVRAVLADGGQVSGADELIRTALAARP